MNRPQTKRVVEQLNIVTLKADKTREAPDVDQLLVELGNTAMAIPFYAIYPANGDPPMTFSGIITSGQVISRLRQAAAAPAGIPSSALETAMKGSE